MLANACVVQDTIRLQLSLQNSINLVIGILEHGCEANDHRYLDDLVLRSVIAECDDRPKDMAVEANSLATANETIIYNCTSKNFHTPYEFYLIGSVQPGSGFLLLLLLPLAVVFNGAFSAGVLMIL